MTTILALDPGGVTGFAVVQIDTPDRPLVIRHYGVIPQLSAGRAGLLAGTDRFLKAWLPRVDEIAMEDGIEAYNLRTQSEAWEVRGCIRLAGEQAGKPVACYHPSTVKSLICPAGKDRPKATKKQVRDKTCGILAVTWPIPCDHISDALAVAVTHAVKVHHWRPPGYIPKVTTRVSQSLIDRIEQKRLEAIKR